MPLYGLIGYPLGHSFSAAWFAEMFCREGITDAAYRNFPLASIEELPGLWAAHPDLEGLNVTAPYKVAVMRYLAHVDPVAQTIGAVNCMVRRPEGWCGYNVDWIGFGETLRLLLAGERPRGLVLGTGGASQAACYALERLGIRYLSVSRTPKNGRQIAYADLSPEVMAAHRLIVNATPLGTFPAVDAAPPIPYDQLTPHHILYDMVYNPPLTAFLRHGQEHGCRISNGRGMLERQGEESWRLFSGR